MSCVFLSLPVTASRRSGASLSESKPDQNNINDCKKPQFYFVWLWLRDKSDWLQGASCESWLGWPPLIWEFPRSVLIVIQSDGTQWGGTLGSHNLSHPEADGNPQSSQRDRVDIIISFLSWIQAIKDVFKRMRRRYLSRIDQSEPRNLATLFLWHVTGGV